MSHAKVIIMRTTDLRDRATAFPLARIIQWHIYNPNQLRLCFIEDDPIILFTARESIKLDRSFRFFQFIAPGYIVMDLEWISYYKSFTHWRLPEAQRKPSKRYWRARQIILSTASVSLPGVRNILIEAYWTHLVVICPNSWFSKYHKNMCLFHLKSTSKIA